ncbi:MAG TPA: hypothetical protein VGE99_03190 [Candidatus Dormibacteraeota bacterium]
MKKGIRGLALVAVLSAAYVFATAGLNLSPTSINGALNRALQQPAAASPAQTPAATVTGHATGLGSSTPQPGGRPTPNAPARSLPAGPAHPSTCPPGSHMRIACAAP